MPDDSTPHESPGGDAADTWSAVVDAAPVVDLSLLAAPGERLLVISAHPDDETIGAGRLIAAWAREVGSVTSIVLTAGEAFADDLPVDPADITACRLEEWRSALSDLGAVPAGCAHLPHGRLAEHVDTITQIVAGLAPTVDAVCAPWFKDPDADHAATGRAVVRVAARTGLPVFAYPVWATYSCDPSVLGTSQLTRFDHTPADDTARLIALTRYRSQLEPLRPGLDPVMPLELFDHHREQLLVSPT